MIVLINAGFIAVAIGIVLSLAATVIRFRYPNSQKALGMSWIGFFLTWGTPVAVGLFLIS